MSRQKNMESDSKFKRLDALDGLRGVAILLVLFSHINLSVFIENKGSNLLSQLIFDSGEIGVGILFILSGFLMVYLYQNPKSKIDFLQKRYTRIFPAFIVACLILSIVVRDNTLEINLTKTLSETFVLIVGIGLFVNIIWLGIIKRLNSNIKRLFFYSFLLFQIVVGLYYFFVVSHQPYRQFTSQLSMDKKVWITGLVNATLTLPFGTYIQPLSSVFWSLVDEVYFYILFPIISIPIIALLASQYRRIKILFLTATLPLFMGFYLIANKLLFFKLLHLELAYFFIGGMTLGYFYRNHGQKIEDRQVNIFLSLLSFLALFFVIFLNHFFLNLSSAELKPFIKMFFAIPFTFLVLMSLNSKTLLSKILKSRILVFLGTISYSLYLIHLLIFELLKKQLGDTKNLVEIFYFVPAYILASIGIAYVMYFLLERPYFLGKDKIINTDVTVNKKPIKKNKILLALTNPRYVLTTFCLGLIILIFVTYSLEFSFFSTQKIYGRSILSFPTVSKNEALISLKDDPKILMSIKAKENNLSVIEMNFEESLNPEIEFKKQILTVSLTEKVTQKLYSSKYYINTQEDELPHLFGFLPIADSKDKIYDVELTLDNTDSTKDIKLDINKDVLKSYYSFDKRQLVRNPGVLVTFVVSKIEGVLMDEEAQKVLLLFFPFVFISAYILIISRAKKAKSERILKTPKR